MVDEISAGVNPARYVAWTCESGAKYWGVDYENARVQQISKTSRNGADGLDIHRLPEASIFARDVLVATSGYTSSATPALQKKIIPIGSFIIATEQLPEALASELSPRNRMIYDSKHYLYYYRLTPDNRMLFGGRAAFFPETEEHHPPQCGNSASRDGRSLSPVERREVDYAWGGTLDFCFDTMPHAGRLDGMYYAVGYAGHGVAMATYLGAKIAQKICGAATRSPTRRFPSPERRSDSTTDRPWFLPFAGAYYKVLDWIS